MRPKHGLLPAMPSRLLFGLALLCLACGDDSAKTSSTATSTQAGTTANENDTTGTATATPTSTGRDTNTGSTGGSVTESPWRQRGPAPVGRDQMTLDTGNDRSVLVHIWYPADEAHRAQAETGEPLELFLPEADAAVLGPVLAVAPEPCTKRTTQTAARVSAAAGDALPVVLFSHCLDCMGFSAASVAEHLASHGFLVAAPDHTDGTLLDNLAGTSIGLDAAFLSVRVADVQATLDELLDANSLLVPKTLRGRSDSTRIGMMGHSFGAVTAARVAEIDPRILAGFLMAAPAQNPLIPGVTLRAINKPLMWLLAQQDNSIGELGNNLLRDNFATANPPVWLAEVQDAGHWSFSDLCATIDAFAPGCGDDMRQTDPSQAFSYIDNELARALAATYATRFFVAHLQDDPAALDELTLEDFDELVTVSARQ